MKRNDRQTTAWKQNERTYIAENKMKIYFQEEKNDNPSDDKAITKNCKK